MRKRVLLAALTLALLIGSCGGAEPAGPDIREQLRGPFFPPEWLAEVQVPFTVEELTATNQYGLTIWGKIHPFQSDPEKFREAVVTLHKVAGLTTEPASKAACYQNLGYFYEGMFQDYVRGFQMFRELETLADEVPQVHDWQNHLGRDTRRFTALSMARCYARLGLGDEARALLAGNTFEDWRELFDLAVICRILGDRKSSDEAVEQAIAAGQEDNWRRVSVGSRGIILFYANGNLEKVKQYMPAYMESYQAMLSQDGGEVLDYLAGQHRMVEFIQRNLDKPLTRELGALPEGTFLGQAPGIHSPIEVSVTVREGGTADVKVINIDETRCFDAANYVARRVVEKRSLDVDAVTGATVTSLGIVEAVREALEGAER